MRWFVLMILLAPAVAQAATDSEVAGGGGAAVIAAAAGGALVQARRRRRTTAEAQVRRLFPRLPPARFEHEVKRFMKHTSRAHKRAARRRP